MVICFFNDVLVIPNLRAIIGVDRIFVFADWVLKIGKFESVIVIFPIFLNAEKMSFWKSENLTLVCLCKLKVERNDSLNIILKVPDKNRIRLGQQYGNLFEGEHLKSINRLLEYNLLNDLALRVHVNKAIIILMQICKEADSVLDSNRKPQNFIKSSLKTDMPLFSLQHGQQKFIIVQIWN